MSNYLAEKISKSKFLRVKPLEQQYSRPKYIIGFDSEADTTSDGRPMLFQFSLPETIEEQVFCSVVPETKHAGLGVFLDFLDEICRSRDVEYLIYVWNLTYELTQLFHDIPDEIKEQSEFHIKKIRKALGKSYDWTIDVFNFKRQIVQFRKGRIVVTLLDGTAFYRIKLDSAAKMLGLGEKYELANLSRESFTRADLQDKEFIRYAKRDAYITRLIGEYIQEQHKQYGIRTTISAPHFAATVFKTHFLHKELGIPDRQLEQAGLYSYHGGKNGFYLSGPSEFATIYQYDITSAYPEAMRQLPNIEQSNWNRVEEYIPNQHALYRVTLDYNPCQYRGMQNHDGSWAQAGLITNTWITGYELDTIVEHKEATIISCSGFLLRGNNGGPLSEFVDRFFNIKRHRTGPERETAKLLLNSLYGKFFQKQPIGIVGTFDLDELRWFNSDPDQSYDYEAGGLYNPPIASLITGFVRAKIHNLEHKYESVMTSTDGLFGFIAPDANDLGKELGKLTAIKGKLRIWRERLYIFDGEDGKRKFALHGFHSTTNDLEKIPLARGEYLYYGNQMITLKMSTRRERQRQYSAGQFVKLPYTLRI